MELFRFNRARAELDLVDPDGMLWPASAFSDADELNALFETALASRVLTASRPRAHIYVYPLSLCEPDPLLAVDPGTGPTLLSYALSPSQREGEDPIAFTVRLLEETTATANAVVEAALTQRFWMREGRTVFLTAEHMDDLTRGRRIELHGILVVPPVGWETP